MASFDVTKRALALGSRDAWSGWHAKSWTESTIEMIIVPKGATRMALLAGVYPQLDAVGLTDDSVAVGDQIKDSTSTYYTIEAIKPHYWGDSLSHYECDLTKETMYQADFAATTWTKTRAEDPRYRTKYWLSDAVEGKLRAAQITKDDDSTLADYAVIFNDPPYPIHLEFRGSSNMQGLYVIDQPETNSLSCGVGYEENVPIHIMTVDSTGCTGTALQSKMEMELRYICENYPFSSLRSLNRRGKNDRDLGGMWVYDTEFILRYKW
jgi:hypothetical protein